MVLFYISLIANDIEHFFTCSLSILYPLWWSMFSNFCLFFLFLFLLFFFGIAYFFLKAYLFIYLWLCWVFVSVRGLSPAVVSGGHSSSRCAGLSPSRPFSLRSTGSRRAGSAIVAHGPSCSTAHGILPDQGSNPCPLHWQADSQPLRHQGSPWHCLFLKIGKRLFTFVISIESSLDIKFVPSTTFSED